MNTTQKVSEALEALATAMEPVTTADQTLVNIHGWNHLGMTGRALVGLVRALSARVNSIPVDRIPKTLHPDPIVAAINSLQTQTMPYMFNGNGAQAIPVFFELLFYIEFTFAPYMPAQLDWEKLADGEAMPRKLATRLRAQKSAMDRFDGEIELIADKIRMVEAAHDAALQLPTDLEELKSAQSEIVARRVSADEGAIFISGAQKQAEALLESISALKQEATKLVENVEDAYSAATTKGLGQAFQTRADRLANSMWTWVAGLIIALTLGAVVGVWRISILQDLLRQNANNESVSLNLILAVLSVAAPIWFAWIATKQIGHRFRLSEDYAFKASVAQAYEGYRREAARLDPAFAKRLFSSALDRIDEAPIRFVEHETFGSPWHELIGRKGGEKSSASISRQDNEADVPASDSPTPNAPSRGRATKAQN